jgi:CBS domain containing-hemolysin-like protein
MVVLVDRPGGQVLGVVTLHDVLRAEAAMAEAGAWAG